MSKRYDAADIEVLTGLEPVRRRPGMYTDTTRPNHLAQEVVDNSIDEALAGHCDEINVQLFKNGSLSVVARAITGARWSGPRFFGLTSEGVP